jgi:quercetin 2,3-dioxygenase
MALERSSIELPNLQNKTYLLFVFSNTLMLNNGTFLDEGDSLIYKNETLEISTESYADLVLFELDEQAKFSRSGMYSGV